MEKKLITAEDIAPQVGALWPVSAPVLLGVQVYKRMEAKQ